MRQVGLVDLHRHLDGSLRPSTARELARSGNIAVPDPLEFEPAMGLSAALDRFAFTLSLLQTPDSVERVAREICEDAAGEGVTTLEIRFAPQLHRGTAAEEIVDAALSGVAGRAGLILCGLYGEPPSVLEHLVEIAAPRRGVVGIDVAGAPLKGHRWRLGDYAGAYRSAKDLGLGRTVHAGEGRPPQEIREAIEILDAQRIGHGTTLLDDLKVVRLVEERGTVIEACPTSNLHTGVIRDIQEHPLAEWLRRGIGACVATDNTLFSAVDAPTEWKRAAGIRGMDETLLERALDFGRAAAFGPR